jgi:hypothetical protein
MELMQLVSSRLALKENLVEQQLASGAAPRAPSSAHAGTASEERLASGSSARVAGLSGREDVERAFLALCIASPQEGVLALEGLDVEEDFSSELLRRAARRLRDGSLHEPMADSAGEAGGLERDPELKRLLVELVVEAGREQAHPAMLEVQRLQLELARVDRQIQQARGAQRGDVSELAVKRGEVKREFDRAQERVLEETGA